MSWEYPMKFIGCKVFDEMCSKPSECYLSSNKNTYDDTLKEFLPNHNFWIYQDFYQNLKPLKSHPMINR